VLQRGSLLRSAYQYSVTVCIVLHYEWCSAVLPQSTLTVLAVSIGFSVGLIQLMSTPVLSNLLHIVKLAVHAVCRALILASQLGSRSGEQRVDIPTRPVSRLPRYERYTEI